MTPYLQNSQSTQGQVAHTYNPSSSGGRYQQDHSSKPAQANSSRDSIWKKSHHKKQLVEWLKVGPKFKPQYNNKKKAGAK
jgi:hypothetical protein